MTIEQIEKEFRKEFCYKKVSNSGAYHFIFEGHKYTTVNIMNFIKKTVIKGVLEEVVKDICVGDENKYDVPFKMAYLGNCNNSETKERNIKQIERYLVRESLINLAKDKYNIEL